MAYNKDTDYQAIINAAVARGDYKTAAQAEQSRNEKISALNASGTNKYNAAATSKYAGWLDNTDYGTIGKQQMASGASAQDVLNTYNNRYNKAAGTEGLNQYANDEIQKEMWDYITQNIGNDKPVFDFGTDRPTYESSYSSRIDEMLNQILNREDFSYDLESDPMFQQYQTMYNREGSRAMNDTLASAAAGAGGMNSYAVTAAQQANDYYSAQLMDKAPELYQLAYQMYLQDIDNQVRDLGLLQEMDNTQYGRYRDTMSDWANDRDFAYGKYRDEMGDYQWMKDFNYSAGRDKVNDDRYDREWEYGVGRDELEDSRYESETAYQRAMQMLASGVMPGDEALKAAGISPSEAAAYIASNAKAASRSGKGSGGSGSGGGGNGGSGGTGGEQDYDGLFRAAMESGHPKSFIANNYKKYGFTSSSGLYDDYGDWELENPAEETGGDDVAGRTFDMQSVRELGYGDLSAEALRDLVERGEVQMHVDGNSIKFKRNPAFVG